MKCDLCLREEKDLSFKTSYALLITKFQESNGVVPSGDKLLRVCKSCNNEKVLFHNAETGNSGHKVTDC